MIEEYNKMVISLKGLIARVTPIKGANRIGVFMAIRKEETIAKMSGAPTITKIEDAITTLREGDMVTDKTGVATVETSEVLTATRKEGNTGISREGRTATNRGGRMAFLTGVPTAKGTTTGIEKQALTMVEPPRGNAVQG